MARRGKDDLPGYKKWAAAIFSGIGFVFILLFVYGPSNEGRSEILRILGAGLIGVGVTAFFTITLPGVDWNGLLVKVAALILSAAGKQDDKGDGEVQR